jgi:hypothetical protein
MRKAGKWQAGETSETRLLIAVIANIRAFDMVKPLSLPRLTRRPCKPLVDNGYFGAILAAFGLAWVIEGNLAYRHAGAGRDAGEQHPSCPWSGPGEDAGITAAIKPRLAGGRCCCLLPYARLMRALGGRSLHLAVDAGRHARLCCALSAAAYGLGGVALAGGAGRMACQRRCGGIMLATLAPFIRAW